MHTLLNIKMNRIYTLILVAIQITMLQGCSSRKSIRQIIDEFQPAFCKTHNVGKQDEQMVSCYHTYDECIRHITSAQHFDYRCNNDRGNPTFNDLGDVD